MLEDDRQEPPPRVIVQQADATAAGGEAPPDDVITLRISRAHLYGILGLVAGLLAGLLIARVTGFGLENGDNPAVARASSDAVPVVDVSTEGQPFRGSADAEVVLVEFLDFQCPFCKRHAEQTLPRILAEYGDEVRYVVRNLPLAIHPFAQKAAEASECADAQGQYWEYHDVLFEHQAALDVDSLKRYARDLGLDATAFDACLDAGQQTTAVKQDTEEAARLGVTSTPTFFLNGRRVVGAKAFDQFKVEIDAVLDTRVAR